MNVLRITTIISAVIVMVLGLPGQATAHERRRVGSLSFYVGLLVEPAVAFEPNALYVAIRDGVSTAEVIDAESTIRAIIVIDGHSSDLSFSPIDGVPGAYQATFTPLKPGPVHIRFSGSVRGETIDAEFVSGPSTFSSIEPGDPSKAPPAQPVSPPETATANVPEGLLFAGILAAGMALFAWRRQRG